MSTTRTTETDLRAALQGINDIHDRLFGCVSASNDLIEGDAIETLYQLIERGLAVADGPLDDPDTIITLRTWTVH